MKRARDELQKDQRRTAIMDEAWEQYRRAGYGEITMGGVAAGAGLAKGTLYLYFPTRESLFLAVLTREFERWFDSVSERLGALVDDSPVGVRNERLAEVLSRSLAAEPGLVQLLAESHVILEQHADSQTISNYKHMIIDGMAKLSAPVTRLMSTGGSGQRDIESLLLAIYATVIGTRTMSRFSGTVTEVLESDSRLSVFQIDFEDSLRRTLLLLLRGAQQPPATSGKENV